MKQFNQTYWDEMYAEEDDSVIDGLDNAKEHARYIKSILNLAEVSVTSIGDFGFGKGILLREIAKLLQPKRLVLIDPSKEAVAKLKKQIWIREIKHKIYETTLENFKGSGIKNPLDLGIFNSIAQYIPDQEIGLAFHKLARLCKYLYFSVPTQLDYTYMKEELNFIDPYALPRPKQFYLDVLSPYFTIVSYNLLESKIHLKESGFVYEFFRF